MSKPRHLTHRFVRDDSGTAVIIGGLLAAAGMILTSISMEYGRAVSHKIELQQALDAATIAVCTAGTQSSDAVIKAHLNAALEPTGRKVGDGDDDIKLTNAEMNAAGEIKPTLTSSISTPMLKFPLFSWMSMDSVDELTVEVTSGVACGSKRLELALMLDVTGSMCWNDPYGRGQSNSCGSGRANNKLTSMKDAVYDVLDIFGGHMTAGATKIGLVPFSEAVNVGDLADDVRGFLPSGTSSQYGVKERYQYVKNWRGGTRTWKASECVTERTGSQAYTNAPPSSDRVGIFYSNSSGTCKPSAEILPLTTNADTIRSKVSGLKGGGGTAGHIGAAWAWYLVSKDWGYLWPQSQVEEKNDEELTKAVILMTDGEFNREYCDGVLSNKIYSCSRYNAKSKTQAKALCDAMKQDGVVVYTVGFQVPNYNVNNPSSQQQLLMDCASDPTKFFFPYNGEALRAAFQEIGRQLAAGQAGQAVVNF